MNTTIKLLLIEDDEDDYILFCDYVSEIRGYDIDLTWIAGYDEALQQIMLNRHDLYILDYRLGEYTGIELLRQAKDHDISAPFLLLTGQGNRDIDIEAMNEGASDYLVKSELNAYLLERSIRYTLEKKKNEDIRVERERLNGIIEMAGAAAHELNQPLQSISGYCRMLFGDMEEARRKELLGKIMDEVERMADITGKLHGITRYITMSYTDDTKIINIEEASRDE